MRDAPLAFFKPKFGRSTDRVKMDLEYGFVRNLLKS